MSSLQDANVLILKKKSKLLEIKENLLMKCEDNYFFSYLVAYPVNAKGNHIELNSYSYLRSKNEFLKSGAKITTKVIYVTRYPVTLSIIDSIIAGVNNEVDLTTLFGDCVNLEEIILDLHSRLKEDKQYCESIKRLYPDFYAFSCLLGCVWVNEDKLDDNLDKQILKLAKWTKSRIR